MAPVSFARPGSAHGAESRPLASGPAAQPRAPCRPVGAHTRVCSFTAVAIPRTSLSFCELGVLTCVHVLQHATRQPPLGARLTLCSHVQLPPLFQALARVALVAGPIVGRAVVDAYKQAMISASPPSIHVYPCQTCPVWRCSTPHTNCALR